MPTTQVNDAESTPPPLPDEPPAPTLMFDDSPSPPATVTADAVDDEAMAPRGQTPASPPFDDGIVTFAPPGSPPPFADPTWPIPMPPTPRAEPNDAFPSRDDAAGDAARDAADTREIIALLKQLHATLTRLAERFESGALTFIDGA